MVMVMMMLVLVFVVIVIVVMMVMMVVLVFILIVVIVVVMVVAGAVGIVALAVIVMVMMMVMGRFLQLCQLNGDGAALLHRLHQLFAGQLRPRGRDNHGVLVVLADHLDALVELFLRHAVGGCMPFLLPPIRID